MHDYQNVRELGNKGQKVWGHNEFGTETKERKREQREGSLTMPFLGGVEKPANIRQQTHLLPSETSRTIDISPIGPLSPRKRTLFVELI
jgi:hypothetical protein